ncbi:MAG: cysteine--tRNA ligase, partial [Patescibacteria group bacterium]
IECSAMCMKYLGSTLDIHCGGADHVQIHHTNEIAQSEAATGKPFSKFWMHAAFLTIRGERMAKSSPETNIIIATLRERGFNPLDFRYLALGTHYRKPLSFSWDALSGARISRLKILQTFVSLHKKSTKLDAALKKQFLEAINDDLNTSRTLAIFWQGLKQNASQDFVLWCDTLLGLNIRAEAKDISKKPTDITLNVKDLLELRETARAEKNWLEADALRQKITRLGFSIKDTPQGPIITKL